jgi:hypothetical protein
MRADIILPPKIFGKDQKRFDKLEISNYDYNVSYKTLQHFVMAMIMEKPYEM